MKKRIFLALLISILCIVAFTVIASAKDVNIGVNDVNGNAIVVPTEDADGDALTWYRVTTAPESGTYYEYVSGETTYYLVSVKTKDAAYVNDSYYLCYSYPGITANAWSGNIIVMNSAGIKDADGNGPQKLNFVFEGTPIAYVYLPASIVSLTGRSGNSEKSLFYAASSLIELEIESGSQIKELNTNGFYNCRNLKRFVLPENLRTINANAFVSLTIEITVPKSVTTFEVSNWANLTVHYTGTAEDHADWTYQPSKIDYVSHCDVYRNGVHTAGEVENYITSCSECGAQMYCENPEHNLTTSISYDSYVQNGVKSVLCTDCGLDAKETNVPAIMIFKGYSKNPEGTSICVGYSMNNSALNEYMSYLQEDAIFEYGVCVALGSNVAENKPLTLGEKGVTVANNMVIKATIDEVAYSKIEVRLNGDFSQNLNTEILMCAYIYDGSKLVYVQDNDKGESAELDFVKSVTIASLTE